MKNCEEKLSSYLTTLIRFFPSSVPDLESGLYFLQIIHKDRQQVYPLIKK